MAAKEMDDFRNEFFLEHPTHVPLNNAGLSLLTKRAVTKLNDVTQRLARDGAFLVPLFREREEAKKTLAKFVNASESETVWVQNCSAAISMVANGYEFKADEEIIILENEYPANFYPWVNRAKCRGSKVHVIPAEKDLTRSQKKVIEKINSKTRIVAFSHVQSDCGYLMDPAAIGEAAHKVGAIVCVDVIQSMGIYPIDFRNFGADIICGGSQKWLCGAIGAGMLIVKEELMPKISPCLHGANNYGTFEDASALDKEPFADSRKFDAGTVSLHSVLGSAESMRVLLEYGLDNLWKKTHELRGYLENGMKELGFTLYGDPKSNGPHLSVTHAKKTLAQFSEALIRERVSHAIRPAPIEGGKVLRISPHAYNTTDELDVALRILKKVLA